jgi:hypothetical protein
MVRTLVLGLLALAALVGGTAPGHAQIVAVRTPRVAVTIGPSLHPGVAVNVPGPVAVPVIQEPPTLPPPQVLPLPSQSQVVPVPAPAPVVLQPMTHRDFAALFQPTPGTHQALLIHPGSKCPVLVSFTLPPGCPKVRAGLREIEFDYGKCEVEIRFKVLGKVAVVYD